TPSADRAPACDAADRDRSGSLDVYAVSLRCTECSPHSRTRDSMRHVRRYTERDSPKSYSSAHPNVEHRTDFNVQGPLKDRPLTHAGDAMGPRPVSAAIVGTVLCLSMPGVFSIAAAQTKSKNDRVSKTPPSAAVVMAPPEIVVAGVRVVGPGYGENRKEL